MALSGLDIYKLLPKTNCRECGFVTCLAFAMQLAKKAVSIDKCPYLSEEAKKTLEASAQPPIKLISIGSGGTKLEIGNETVLFRHEAKFVNPCGIGFIIEDSLQDAKIKENLSKINSFKFERVGQELAVNLVAVKQTKDKKRFVEAVKIVSENTILGLVIISPETAAIKEALAIIKENKPLIYNSDKNALSETAKLSIEYKVPMVAFENDLEKLSNLTADLTKQGVSDIVLDTGEKPIARKIWDLTQIRRLSLKKANRSLGFPVLTITEKKDPHEEAMEAATYITKYAGIVLLHNIEAWEVLPILTLRQNIYTDPQKPLQVEPGLYPIGDANKDSQVLITTNFSLSYYTVLGEVEASRIPSYILSVDTEGMSVLTAWAAEKFTPEKITQSINKFSVPEKIAHKRIIIPGYVAVMSGDLEETSGFKVVVGPKEASGIPSFLKNL